MKTTVALVIALITLASHSANATTLRIAEGGVFLAGGGWGHWARFTGNNFSVLSGSEPYIDPYSAFGTEPFSWTFQFSDLAFVQVGDQGCQADPDRNIHCGSLTLTSPGLAMPDDWPDTSVFTARVPFRATGFLLVGDNRYNITGQGTLTGERCLNILVCGVPLPPVFQTDPEFRTDALVAYTFAVAEPATRLLMLAFTLTMVGLLLVHRRAAVEIRAARPVPNNSNRLDLARQARQLRDARH
jgi:hypothetical protein